MQSSSTDFSYDYTNNYPFIVYTITMKGKKLYAEISPAEMLRRLG